MRAARASVQACDLLLIAGTSLVVQPAAEFPTLALQAGARIILVNQTATSLDDMADIVIRADVVEVLPALVRAVRRLKNAPRFPPHEE